MYNVYRGGGPKSFSRTDSMNLKLFVLSNFWA